MLGLSLLNKRVGVGTSLLYDARPGDRIGCLGPLGRPFVPVDPPAEAWMVAGGVGLAPFVTLAEALAARRTSMTLFYGGRSAADLYYADFFAELGATLVLTTEDGSRGERGRVTAPLERALAERGAAHDVTIYACGPTPMMSSGRRLGHARQHGRCSSRSNRSWAAAWAAATVVSSASGRAPAVISSVRASTAPYSTRRPSSGTRSTAWDIRRWRICPFSSARST